MIMKEMRLKNALNCVKLHRGCSIITFTMGPLSYPPPERNQFCCYKGLDHEVNVVSEPNFRASNLKNNSTKITSQQSLKKSGVDLGKNYISSTSQKNSTQYYTCAMCVHRPVHLLPQNRDPLPQNLGNCALKM
jgi:hypothetical protein